MQRTPNPNSQTTGSLGGPLITAQITDGLSNTAAVSEILVSDGSPDIRRASFATRSSYMAPNERDTFCNACLQYAYRTRPNGQVSFGGWTRGRPWYDGTIYQMYNHLIRPNGPSCKNGPSSDSGSNTVGSLHANGVNVAFLDGRTIWISDKIDLMAWRNHGSRHGHEP